MRNSVKILPFTRPGRWGQSAEGTFSLGLFPCYCHRLCLSILLVSSFVPPWFLLSSFLSMHIVRRHLEETNSVFSFSILLFLLLQTFIGFCDMISSKICGLSMNFIGIYSTSQKPKPEMSSINTFLLLATCRVG